MRDVKKEQELINQIQDFINNLGVKETLNVLSSITIDSCSTKIHGQEIAIKLEVFGALQVLKAFGIMPASKLGFSKYSEGTPRFDVSKNSIFMIGPNGNTRLTLNGNSSLTVNLYEKKFTNVVSGKVVDNFSVQCTIEPKTKK